MVVALLQKINSVLTKQQPPHSEHVAPRIKGEP